MDQLNQFIGTLNEWNAAVGGLLAVTGWLCTVAALILAVVFFYAGHQPRRFGWQILSLTQVWNPELDKLPHKVPLELVSGTTTLVGPAMVIILRMGNTGRMSVDFDDKLPPVQIKFNKATLVDAKVVDTSNSDIKAELLRPTSQSVTFRPSMLQRRQWLELILVTQGVAEHPRITATVKDETAAACDVKRLQFKAWWLVLLSSVAVFLLGANFLGFMDSSPSPDGGQRVVILKTPAQYLAAGATYLSLFMFIYGVRTVWKKFRWAKKRS
jgi:hypothetical protein